MLFDFIEFMFVFLFGVITVEFVFLDWWERGLKGGVNKFFVNYIFYLRIIFFFGINVLERRWDLGFVFYSYRFLGGFRVKCYFFFFLWCVCVFFFIGGKGVC